jgi:hypothetical protein
MTAMPQMLSEGAAPSPRDQMRTILEGMTLRTWERDRADLLRLLDQI